MRLIFMGSPDFAVPSLRALHAAGHQVATVVTQPDRPRGRGRKPRPTAVKEAARQLGLPVYQPQDVNESECVEEIRSLEAEAGAVVAYGEILSPELLRATDRGFLNLHASLLPEYRGAAPVNWAIVRGEEVTGVSVIWMEPRMDAGPILAQRQVQIGRHETAGELSERLAELGAEVLTEVVDMLDAGERIEEKAQPERPESLAPKLRKTSGRTDWSLPAEAIRNHVRGMTPWPSAFTHYVGEDQHCRVTLLEVRAEEGPKTSKPQPGRVLEAGSDGILVQAGRGAVRILKLKPAGSRALDAADFVNGYRVAPGDWFE